MNGFFGEQVLITLHFPECCFRCVDHYPGKQTAGQRKGVFPPVNLANEVLSSGMEVASDKP